MSETAHPFSYQKPKFEVADIFRLYGEDYRSNHPMPAHHHYVMNNILNCRTSLMGGHVDACDHCGFQQNAYNSCGDRHCPKCRGMAKEQWVSDRKAELLPAGYFHNVFTLPHELNPLILCNMAVMLNLLFESVGETLQAFAGDPKWRLNGQLGYIAVLHTWTQTLMDHFHLHCLIPGGALSYDKSQWTPAREKYLFGVKPLAKAFKKCYIGKLEKAFEQDRLIFPGNTASMGTEEGFRQLIKELWNKKWIVYAKRPFAGPEQVLDYLGRYTHRVALSNHRIRSIDNGSITFAYRDRKDGGKEKEMTLSSDEFIRRFMLHILPKGFTKIRYFGFMFHRNKRENILLIRRLIEPDKEPEEIVKTKESVREIMMRLSGTDIGICPQCKKGQMHPIVKIPKYTSESKAAIYCGGFT